MDLDARGFNHFLLDAVNMNEQDFKVELDDADGKKNTLISCFLKRRNAAARTFCFRGSDLHF